MKSIQEQKLKRKGRRYYHASPYDFEIFKGEKINDYLTIGFITTSKLYAIKYLLDFKKIKTGWLYEVGFNIIPDIFDANSPVDIKKWKSNYPLNNDHYALESLKSFDWLYSTKIAFYKDRKTVLENLFNMGYDGYSCYESTQGSGRTNHSIGIFSPEETLKIKNKELIKDYKNSNENKIELFLEHIQLAENMVHKKLKKPDTKFIPIDWINSNDIEFNKTQYIKYRT